MMDDCTFDAPIIKAPIARATVTILKEAPDPVLKRALPEFRHPVKKISPRLPGGENSDKQAVILDSKMGKRFIGFRHSVGIFFLFKCPAFSFTSGQNFSCELIGHAFP